MSNPIDREALHNEFIQFVQNLYPNVSQKFYKDIFSVIGSSLSETQNNSLFNRDCIGGFRRDRPMIAMIGEKTRLDKSVFMIDSEDVIITKTLAMDSALGCRYEDSFLIPEFVNKNKDDRQIGNLYPLILKEVPFPDLNEQSVMGRIYQRQQYKGSTLYFPTDFNREFDYSINRISLGKQNLTREIRIALYGQSFTMIGPIHLMKQVKTYTSSCIFNYKKGKL